jgi:hypothetical protein
MGRTVKSSLEYHLCKKAKARPEGQIYHARGAKKDELSSLVSLSPYGSLAMAFKIEQIFLTSVNINFLENN